MAASERVDIGFIGGQVLSAKLDADALKALGNALQSGAGWHEIASADERITIDAGKVAYVRVDAGEHSVGFSSGS